MLKALLFVDSILHATVSQRDRFRKDVAFNAEKWFKIIEYLIIVGILKIVVERVGLRDKIFVGILYILSYFFWFFYCLDIFIDLQRIWKVSSRISAYIGMLIGFILSYMANTVAIKLTSM